MNLSQRRKGAITPYTTPCAYGALWIALVSSVVQAKEPRVETILTGLQNPRGMAIRPVETADHDQVFIAEAGANQVVKLRSNEPKWTVAIGGFDAAPADEGNGSPVALVFLDAEQLVVGCASAPVVRVYKLTDGDQPVAADMSGQRLDGENVVAIDAICRTQANDKVSDLLIVSCRSREAKNWLGSVPVRAGMIDKLSPFSPIVRFADNQPPLALAVSPQGFVVVGSRGAGESQVGLLTFINPIQGSPVMELAVALPEITGLAFGPKTGNLFAIGATPKDKSAGGLFRIDDASVPGKPSCKAVKITDLSDPRALAFAPDGTLYVTAIDPSKSGDSKNGVLLRVHGDL